MRVEWTAGALRNAVEANRRGRLTTWIEDEESEPLALFSPEARANSTAGDWYGEHVGKWLCAASPASRHAPELLPRVETAVHALSKWQESDGYSGTYAPGARCRMSNPEIANGRTWDVWTHAWLIRGLLAAREAGIRPEMALETAERAAVFLLTSLRDRPISDFGNHAGMSAAVAIDPLARLFAETGDTRFASGAQEILDGLESQLGFLSGPAAGRDASEVGTGKIYQFLWILQGVLRLARATGRDELLEVVRTWWQNVHDHHLTPFGGPWGGIGTHYEVFNRRGFFSPEGMVETCSTATWISLSHELYGATGDETMFDSAESALLNGLLGASAPNGQDWIYFTFPNGRRNHTYHWACCKSSGALALEEASRLPVRLDGDALRINLFEDYRFKAGEWEATLQRLEGWTFRLQIERAPTEPSSLTVRRPPWAKRVEVSREGVRPWKPGDSVEITLEVVPVVHPFTYTLDHHGQEIVRTNYAWVSLGPYSYATGLLDGFRRCDTLRLARLFPSDLLREAAGDEWPPDLALGRQGRNPVLFEPFYRAGGRHDGAWRALWQQVAWQ